MAYSGPTFVETADYVAYQQKQFDEMAKSVPLPSEPYRVEVETQTFDDLVKDVPPPGDEISVRIEQERFDQLLAEQPPLDLAHVGEGAPEPSVAPEAASMPPSSGAPSDPVSKTLAFLGLGSGQNHAPPVQAEGPYPGALPTPPEMPAPLGMGRPEEAPGTPTDVMTPRTDGGLVGQGLDALGQLGTGIATGLDAAGGVLGDAVGQVPGGEWAVDALRSQAAATTERRRLGDAAGLRVFQALQRGEEPDPADREAMMAEPVELAMGVSGEGLAKAGGGLVDAAGNLLRPAKGTTAQILDAAGDVLKDVKVKASKPMKETLEQAIQPEAVLPAHQVGAVRQLVDRSRNVIASQGRAGKELAERIHEWREASELTANEWVNRLPTVKKLAKNEMENLVDVLEAKGKPLNARVTQAADETRAVFDEVYAYAQNAGVDVGAKVKDYFPHTFKRDVLERHDELMKYLVETGQAADDEAARAILNRYSQATRDRRYGSLEMEREANLPGYEKTKEALYNHLMNASRRVHEVAQFGPKDAIKDKLLAEIGKQGGDIATVNDLFQTIVRAKTYGELQQKYTSAIRLYNTITRLGLATIGNVTQIVNTGSVVGMRRAVGTEAKVVAGSVLDTVRAAFGKPAAKWSQAEKDFAEKSAVLLDSVIREVREGAGWSDKLTGYAMPGFGTVEKVNRTVAVLAGRDFAIEQARKAASGSGQAKRALEKLGLDVEAVVKRGGKLTEDEQIRAARNVVERTQFRVDPQDLPGWASSPWGKVVAQFRTFGYNQTAFIGRELLEEAKNGNVMPLIRYAIAAPLAGAVAVETRNLVQGREPEEDPVKRVAQYTLGTMGVAGDAARAVLPINAKNLPAERQASMIAGSLLGPSLGTLTDVAGGFVNATRGNWTPAARTGLRQIPVVGTAIQNRMLPYADESETSGRGGRSTSDRAPARTGRR